MATHSSTPAWRIPWTEEPGRLQSMGSKKIPCTQDWSVGIRASVAVSDSHRTSSLCQGPAWSGDLDTAHGPAPGRCASQDPGHTLSGSEPGLLSQRRHVQLDAQGREHALIPSPCIYLLSTHNVPVLDARPFHAGILVGGRAV